MTGTPLTLSSFLVLVNENIFGFIKKKEEIIIKTWVSDIIYE